MTPHKFRQLGLVLALSACLPLAIVATHFAAATLPFAAAAIIGGTTCGASGYFLLMALCKLVLH